MSVRIVGTILRFTHRRTRVANYYHNIEINYTDAKYVKSLTMPSEKKFVVIFSPAVIDYSCCRCTEANPSVIKQWKFATHENFLPHSFNETITSRTYVAPSDARLVIWVGFILALGGPGIGRGECLAVPGYESVGQQICLVALALWGRGGGENIFTVIVKSV